ncbi:MAG: nuclear transport factor 2 family protein [Dokdonella sp.]
MSNSSTSARPEHYLHRLTEAINAHDLDSIVACFAPDLFSEQPAHPARNFRGREQLRSNWAQILAGIKDFHAELVAQAVNVDIVWSEWRWCGMRSSGEPFAMNGVTVQRVGEEGIDSVRFFMEPVDLGGADVVTAVREAVAP